jgi:hypothetical protein
MATGAVRVQDFLRNLPLFRELAPEELDRIAAATAQVRAPTGTILFRRGEPCAGAVALLLVAVAWPEPLARIGGLALGLSAVVLLRNPVVAARRYRADSGLPTARADVLEALDDVHQRQPLRVPREAIASAGEGCGRVTKAL